MEDRIPIERCRQLLGTDKSYSDEQIKQIRDCLYAFGALIVERVKAIKDAFTKRIQSINCRAFIIKGLDVKQHYIDKMLETVTDVWNKRKVDEEKEYENIDRKIAQLKITSAGIVDKIKMLGSETAVKYMEDELIKAELEVKELEDTKIEKKQSQEEIDIEEVVANARNFLEHLEELLIDRDNPVKSAEYFSLIFEDAPTYEEIVSGTPQLAPFLAYKDSFDDVLVQNGERF